MFNTKWLTENWVIIALVSVVVGGFIIFRCLPVHQIHQATQLHAQSKSQECQGQQEWSEGKKATRRLVLERLQAAIDKHNAEYPEYPWENAL